MKHFVTLTFLFFLNLSQAQRGIGWVVHTCDTSYEKDTTHIYLRKVKRRYQNSTTTVYKIFHTAYNAEGKRIEKDKTWGKQGCFVFERRTVYHKERDRSKHKN